MKIDLERATTQALLAHAVSFDGGDEVLGMEMCRGAAMELSLIAEYVQRAPPGGSEEAESLGPVLEQISRRIDVGLELVDRQAAGHPTNRSGSTEQHGEPPPP